MQRFNAACCVTTADILVLLPSFHLVIGVLGKGFSRSAASEAEVPSRRCQAWPMCARVKQCRMVSGVSAGSGVVVCWPSVAGGGSSADPTRTSSESNSGRCSETYGCGAVVQLRVNIVSRFAGILSTQLRRNNESVWCVCVHVC